MIIRKIQEFWMYLFQIIWSITKHFTNKFHIMKDIKFRVFIWFTNQNSNTLEIEHKINITLVIK